VVIVIGGAHSNNTHELVKTCLQFCARVHHVQTAAELQPEWFSTGDIVGITAGTSTPDAIINSVENAIQVWTASSWGTATEATPPAMSR
jgi:4-hydroxy-3-methylbut-2-enyl diphosphate reductase